MRLVRSLHAMNVFVVEDSEPFRRELVGQLSLLTNVSVVGHAATADSAISGILACTPDVLTLDLCLASGTGLDVLAAVRDACPGMIVLVLTNHADAAHRMHCASAGAKFFFDKSTQFDEALALCGSLARAHYAAAGAM
jgi:two-component system, NarL family, response regulator DevR